MVPPSLVALILCATDRRPHEPPSATCFGRPSRPGPSAGWQGEGWQPVSVPPSTPLIASGAAALRLGLHRSTLYLAIKRGLITPDLITSGRHARFSEATLDAYAEQLRHTFATRPSSTLKLRHLLLALGNGASAEPPLLESLRQIQRRLPALTALGIVEPVTPTTDEPGYRIVAQIGVSSAIMERYRRLYGRVNLSIPHVLATGEPIYLDDASRQPPHASGNCLTAAQCVASRLRRAATDRGQSRPRYGRGVQP